MFINTPENYSSLYDELTYNYSTSHSPELKFEICDEEIDKIIGVKKFYSTNSASFNISPIIRHRAMIEIDSTNASGFYVPQDGYLKIKIKRGQEESATNIYTLARYNIENDTLLTTMPRNRIISYGECDTLRLKVESGSEVIASIKAIEHEGNPDITIKSLDPTLSHNGIICFKLNTLDFNPSTTAIEVAISSNTASTTVIHYTLCNQGHNTCRLAWISSAGSLERYTFPNVSQATVQSDGSKLYSLESAFGSKQEIGAVSEIVYSSRVWVCNTATPDTQVEVTDSQIPIYRDGELPSVKLNIRKRNEHYY